MESPCGDDFIQAVTSNDMQKIHEMTISGYGPMYYAKAIPRASGKILRYLYDCAFMYVTGQILNPNTMDISNVHEIIDVLPSAENTKILHYMCSSPPNIVPSGSEFMYNGILIKLIKKSDIQATFGDGGNLLHVAARSDNYRVILHMGYLSLFPDLNQKNKRGQTPLDVATSSKNFTAAGCLMTLGNSN